MKVMVLVKASKDSEAGVMPSEQLLADMGKFNEELANAGILLQGEGLRPTSKSVRVRFDGASRLVIDGPFAETKELVAGYWVWKVKSMEEAIGWLKRCPNPHGEPCEVEIRPIFEPEDFGPALSPELREQEERLRRRTEGAALQPRFEMAPEKIIAGFNARYSFETRSGIPDQWHQFGPQLGRLPGPIGGAAYGVCWNYQPGAGFDYLVGMQVPSAASLPAEFTSVTLPAGKYAVFTHREHVSKIPEMIETIWQGWLPCSGLKAAPSPAFERYTDEFSPQTGMGGMDIWIPLAG